MLIVAFGGVLALAITSLLIIQINPDEFKDMLYASEFQSTLVSAPVPIIKAVLRFGYNHLRKIILFSPFMIIGVICFCLNVWRNAVNRKFAIIFFHVTMWLMPALFMALSNKYFSYHFIAYYFPSLIELYFWLMSPVKKRVVYMLTYVLTIFYVCFFSIVSPHAISYIKTDLEAYHKTEVFLESVNFDRSSEILYLDDGKGAYTLGNQSYLKYFYPLPLQRLDRDSKLECYTDSLNRVMKYTGKYISLYDSWFFYDGKNAGIKAKIDNEYICIGRYYAFTPFMSLRVKCEPHEFLLYKRKNID